MKDRNTRAEVDIFPPEGRGIGAVGGIGHVDPATAPDSAPLTWADKYAGRLWIPDSEVRGGFREWYVGRVTPSATRGRRARRVGFQQPKARS